MSKLGTKVKSKVFSHTITRKNDSNYKEKCQEIFLDIVDFSNNTNHKKQMLLVCFSCYVWNIDAVKNLSKKLKENFQDVIIIWGGPEICKDFILNGVFDSCPVNYLIYGEGESILTKLFEALVLNKISHIDFIENIARKKNNKFVCNDHIDQQKNITENSSAILNGCMDEVLSFSNMRVNIETQRGCNFRCAYCFYHKSFKGIRYRDPNIVIDEILYVYNRGCKEVRITDANFVSNKKHVLTIMNGIIKNKIKMNIMIECLPQFIDQEITDVFKRYINISNDNKLMIGIGIQSLNEKSMKTIRRCINKKYFKKAFELLKMKNVIIKSDIILGLPYETKETFYQSIDFLVNLQRNGQNLACVGLLRILPGTDLVKIADDLNLVYDKNDSEHNIYSTPTLPRADILECLRVTTVVSRILSTKDNDSKMKLRDLYFEVKDALDISNIELLCLLADFFSRYLYNKNSDYVKADFPNAEHYYCYKIDNDIPDEEVKNMLLKLKNTKRFERKIHLFQVT